MFKYLRIDEVKKRNGDKSNSSIYEKVTAGTMTPPIKIGPRASAWPDFEIDMINAARMVEKSEDEIRELVKKLIVKRKEMANEILSAA